MLVRRNLFAPAFYYETHLGMSPSHEPMVPFNKLNLRFTIFAAESSEKVIRISYLHALIFTPNQDNSIHQQIVDFALNSNGPVK